jgi:hypothetical protein
MGHRARLSEVELDGEAATQLVDGKRGGADFSEGDHPDSIASCEPVPFAISAQYARERIGYNQCGAAGGYSFVYFVGW